MDDLEPYIQRLKKERNAVVLAHYYQESEIQDLADHVGDSLGGGERIALGDELGGDGLAVALIHLASVGFDVNPGH